MKKIQGLRGMMASAMFALAGCGTTDVVVGSDGGNGNDGAVNACSVELTPVRFCPRACGTSSVGLQPCVNGVWGSCECPVPDASAPDVPVADTNPPPDVTPTDAPVADTNPPPDAGPTCAFNETLLAGRCVSNCGVMGCTVAGQQCLQVVGGTWVCINPTPPDAGPSFLCELHQTRECFCAGGIRSAQECMSDRSAYGPCQCPTMDASVPDASAPDAPVADTNPPPPDVTPIDASVDVPLMCPPGTADCDMNRANGCEVNTGTTLNCGACGRVCPVAPTNATAACSINRCISVCNMGWGDCNGTASDGCETNTNTTITSCGACGRTCSAPANAVPTCAASTCGYTCMTGYADCDRNPANGCEVNTSTAEGACGRCGNTCSTGQFCANGACQFECTPGAGGVTLTSCPGGATCINLATDLANCGRCGNVCVANVHAHATCAQGACGNACNTGFGDCDNIVANGCERELVSDPLHCGACRNACPTPTNATATCAASRCGFTCNMGWGNCNGSVFDGCEVNLSNNTNNCGTCGRSCPSGQSCVAGACTGPITPVCPSGRLNCGFYGVPVCIDPASDRFNCGDCGFYSGFFVCTSREVCAAGACRLCPFGQMACGNTCTDLANNTNNCGACGRACASTQTCVAGACVTPCAAGQTSCGGACVTTATDVNNCGGCGTVCSSRANATGVTCSAGACGYGSCNMNFGDCNGAASDGCETSLVNNNAHCGRCGGACGSGTTCSGTTCVPVTTVDAGTDASVDAGSDASVDAVADVTDAGADVSDGGVIPFTCPAGTHPRAITYTPPPTVPSECGTGVTSDRPVFWGQSVTDRSRIGVASDVTVTMVGDPPNTPEFSVPFPTSGTATSLPLRFTNTAFWPSGVVFYMSARCNNRTQTYYEGFGYWARFTTLAAAGGSFIVDGVERANDVVSDGRVMMYTMNEPCIPN